MKNIVLSAVAVLAMSSFAVAGGDIAPVEEPVVVEPVVTDAGFYLGLGYGLLNTEATDVASPVNFDENFDEIMFQAGYKFNSYIAVEGRYWAGLDSTIDDVTPYDMSVDAWGIYVKPMYPVTDAFDVYALLGYASSAGSFSDAPDTDDQDGFSWGLGAAYSFTDNIAVFVDYVSLYDDQPNAAFDTTGIDAQIDTWNFGVTYQF